MKREFRIGVITIILLLTLIGFGTVSAQNVQNNDIAGQWQATWNTMIGVMNCQYTFIVNGEVLTGKVVVESDGSKSEADITEGKIKGDEMTFTEMFQGSIKMVYTGKIVGDEIKFKRDAGGFAVEEAVAKRISNAE